MAFETPLPTDYQAGDPNFPAAFNATNAAVNHARRYSEYTGVRDLSSLVTPFAALSGSDSCTGFKQGLMFGIRMLTTVKQDQVSATSHTILTGLPLSWRPQANQVIVGRVRVAGQPDLHLVAFDDTLRIERPDGAEFSLSAGSALRFSFVNWSWIRGTEADIPGVHAAW